MCTSTSQNSLISESDRNADARYVPSSSVKEWEGMFSADGIQNDNKALPAVQLV